MKKTILLFSILSTLLLNSGFAQNDSTKIKGMVYSFVPQYLLNKGIRIDIEKQITPRSFIQVCPQFYLGENKSDNSSNMYYTDYDYYYDDEEFNSIIGGGLNIYHKIFSRPDFMKKGVYFSYGLSYNYYEIDYYDQYLDATINAKATIQKYGGDIILGYQFFFKNKLSLDIYTGVGTRFSNMETNADNTDRFNKRYWGYRYSGNLMHLGVRIGIIL